MNNFNNTKFGENNSFTEGEVNPSLAERFDAMPALAKILIGAAMVLLVAMSVYAVLLAWFGDVGQQQSATQQTAATTAEIATTTADIPDDWKTYRNERYGFQIQYPPGWSVAAKVMATYDPAFKDMNSFGIRPVSDPNNPDSSDRIDILIRDAQEFFADSKANNLNEWVQIMGNDAGEVTIGNRSVYFWKSYHDYYEEYEHHVYFQHKEYIYRIEVLGDSSKEMYKRILSTLTFDEDSDIANWKTYRNEEYGFEIEYPSGWYISKPYQDRASFFLSNYSQEERSKLNPGEQPSDMNGIYLKLMPAENQAFEKTLAAQLKSYRERKGYTIRELPNSHNLQAWEVHLDHNKALVEQSYDSTKILIGNQNRYVMLNNSWVLDSRSQELHDADADIMREMAKTSRFTNDSQY